MSELTSNRTKPVMNTPKKRNIISNEIEYNNSIILYLKIKNKLI